MFHGRVFSQGVFRGCSRFYEHGVFRVFRGVFMPLGCSIGDTIVKSLFRFGDDHTKIPVITFYRFYWHHRIGADYSISIRFRISMKQYTGDVA